MAGESSTVAIFGAGVMGEALLSGLLRGEEPGHRYLITEKRPDRVAELRERYPQVEVVDNVTAAKTADVLALVVKPQDMTALLDEIGEYIQEDALVVSLAAGITTTRLEESLPKSVAVVRAMPNTPALVDEGMAAISPGSHCDPVHLDRASAMLRAVGQVVQVPESYQDAVTAISGSGPAYVFYVVEAMIEAGVLLGLPRATATTLAVQTLYGAATMLRETGEHPTVLRENVSSPAGTTVAALRELEDHKVRAAFLSAMEAARDRSRELAEG